MGGEGTSFSKKSHKIMKGLLKLLKLITKIVPKSVKYAFARKIGNVLFNVRQTRNYYSFDKQLLWIFIKALAYYGYDFNDLEKVEKIISDHDDELDYLRFVEKVERYKAFRHDFEYQRLDYNKENFDHILKVNQDLIKRFPDDFLLQDRMARNYVAGGYQNKARFHFVESLRLQRKEKLKKGKTGLIFIAGMHRGGTGFTYRSLRDGLGIKDIKGSFVGYNDGYYPKYGIVEMPINLNNTHLIPMPDGIISTHAGGIEPNLKTLQLLTDRLVVIVRDPRQALVSKVYYSEFLRYLGNVQALIEYQYPDGFFQWPFAKKVDWQIDNYYFPADFEWVKGWLNADTDPNFPCEIHFSRFEVLANDQKKYFQEILSFYDLPKDKFTYPQKPEFKSNTHLRKGLTDEWRQVLSRDQIQKINELIPEAWFERFNWPKI